mmetsp:Transcript_14515/g.26315  ORF Transcript_14515/g.26315 Transcript_14515/m.26315 type:complete len:212 (-) Transcript_14515:493-1128(-)
MQLTIFARKMRGSCTVLCFLVFWIFPVVKIRTTIVFKVGICLGADIHGIGIQIIHKTFQVMTLCEEFEIEWERRRAVVIIITIFAAAVIVTILLLWNGTAAYVRTGLQYVHFAQHIDTWQFQSHHARRTHQRRPNKFRHIRQTNRSIDQLNTHQSQIQLSHETLRNTRNHIGMGRQLHLSGQIKQQIRTRREVLDVISIGRYHSQTLLEKF